MPPWAAARIKLSSAMESFVAALAHGTARSPTAIRATPSVAASEPVMSFGKRALLWSTACFDSGLVFIIFNCVNFALLLVLTWNRGWSQHQEFGNELVALAGRDEIWFCNAFRVGYLRSFRREKALATLRRFAHNSNEGGLHFPRHPFQLGRMEHRQQNGWLQSSQNGLTALLVDGNPAGQCGRDAHVLVENFLRLLGLIYLEDQTFAGELHALLRHGLFEVVNRHDAKVIGLNGGVQGSRSFTHGLVGGQFDQHRFLSCLTVHFTARP